MTSEPEVLIEEKLTPEVVEAMSQDEKFERLSRYRQLIANGTKLGEEAYVNSVIILRATRARAIKDNAKASKGAKKASEVTPLDLSDF